MDYHSGDSLTGFFGFEGRIVKLSATVCQKILHMGFHSLTLCEDVDLTAFGSVQRPVLYNYQYLFAWENIPGLIHLYSQFVPRCSGEYGSGQ